MKDTLIGPNDTARGQPSNMSTLRCEEAEDAVL